MRISVITCAWNPDRDRFARVLDSLRAQTLPRDQWEYVVVDNGSRERLDGRLDLSALPMARVVLEPEMGLTRARLKGVAESRGDLLAFVDDDNLLAPDYLEVAIRLLDKYPFIGVLGGVGRGEFQGPVEPWMKEVLFVLGVSDYQPAHDMEIQYGLARRAGPWMPIGAGMVVRRRLAEAYRDLVAGDAVRAALDRTGERSLLGGGDTDLVFTATDLGLASGVSSLLRFTHVIPAWRLRKDYLARLFYAGNYGGARIMLLHGWRQPELPETGLAAGIRARLDRWRPRGPVQECWYASAKGLRDGLTGAPYDKRYA